MTATPEQSRLAGNVLQKASNKDKNAALEAIHAALVADKQVCQRVLCTQSILDANKQDLAGNQASIPAQLAKRLLLSDTKFEDLLQGVRDVVSLPDPTGKCTLARALDDGLDLYRYGVNFHFISCDRFVLPTLFFTQFISNNTVLLARWECFW